MSDATVANRVPDQPAIAVPATLEQALDPKWLAQALASVGRGAAVASVREVELIKTVATKVRFEVQFEGEAGPQAFCLKGLLDVDEMTARGGSTCVLEADFYCRVAPTIDVRVPECVSAVVDRDAQQAVIIMRDLIAGGAHFCSAMEEFSADQAAASLGQLAKLHMGSAFLDGADWIRPRAAELARMTYITPEMLQELMDGPRKEGVPESVLNAAQLVDKMKVLADRDSARPQFMIHGDSHAGNNFRTSEGCGLIDWQLLQRGGWALDVAYHLCAVLPVDVAEREERRLMNDYLATMRSAGFDMPDDEAAWEQYREAVVYGYYLWAITRRVDPPIINLFFNRLGNAVARHDSYRLLGLS
ncbi:MAG: phosphotransferase [Novosphingobium sp.]|nr:phosphotransferase [Novosphingobium sp.]